MRKNYLILGVIILSAGHLPAQQPRLLTTNPRAWSVGVDSHQSEISIHFSEPMRVGFWDWLGLGTLSPPSDLHTSVSADATTLGLNVRLQPGKVYVLGLNERGIPGVGFQNEKGISAKPSYLVFQTAGNSSQEDSPPRALSTFPVNGVQDVNPATTKGITVTFDKAMQIKKHGFHLFQGKQPIDLKAVTFTYSADGKIFTLNYPVKPSTHYEVQMNSTEDIGFAATNRVPLWPVHFAFTTGQPH